MSSSHKNVNTVVQTRNWPIISVREFVAPSPLSPFCGSSRWQRWSSMRLLWNLLRRSKKQSSSEGSRPSFWKEETQPWDFSKDIVLIHHIFHFVFWDYVIWPLVSSWQSSEWCCVPWCLSQITYWSFAAEWIIYSWKMFSLQKPLCKMWNFWCLMRATGNIKALEL